MSVLGESRGLSTELLIDILQSQEHVEAALLYGSVARGDAEHYSDIDLLALCSVGYKRVVYDNLTTILSGTLNRVSLSIYSQRELNFLAKAKSLFLLHLSRESIVLIDRTGWMTGTISEFAPKESYDDDFRKSLDLISPLQTVVLNSPNQLHRLAYAYSLFRVFGVYLLAARRIFEFSKAKMAESLITAFPNENRSVQVLSKLRILNANFFSGGTPSRETPSLMSEVPSIENAVTALAGLVGSAVKFRERTYPNAVEEFLDAAKNHSFHLGYRLRTWFLLLAYDGLNLYCKNNGAPTLTSFSESGLLRLVDSREVPDPVRRAASLGVEYLRNYPLKYFLLEDSKIPTRDACFSLVDLARLVDTQ